MRRARAGAISKSKRRKLSAAEVALMMKVRDQIIRIQRTETEPDISVEEYRGMDRTVMQMEIVNASYRFGPNLIYRVRPKTGEDAAVEREVGSVTRVALYSFEGIDI